MLDKINTGLEFLIIVILFLVICGLICWLEGFALLWLIKLFMTTLEITFWKSVGAGLALNVVALAFRITVDRNE